MLSSKLFNTFAICLVLTGPARSNLAGRITAARRESFRRVPPKGSSTKDDGGKHLRAALAQVGGNDDMLFPGSNVPVSDLFMIVVFLFIESVYIINES